MTKTIRQTVTIGAPPKKVYEALLNEKKHSKFTGRKAVISRKAGGAFTCYGTYLSGFNVDLVPGKRIVQAWRSSGWPKGTFSIATFALSRAPRGGTKLRFTQIGVPASSQMDINKGWRTYYWKPLKAYLEK
jgi:activator of HSP90 ATPase